MPERFSSALSLSSSYLWKMRLKMGCTTLMMAMSAIPTTGMIARNTNASQPPMM